MDAAPVYRILSLVVKKNRDTQNLRTMWSRGRRARGVWENRKHQSVCASNFKKQAGGERDYDRRQQ